MAKIGAGTLASRLLNTRLELALTQVAVAATAKIGQSALSSLETGETTHPQAGTLLRLAAALGVEPTWLQTGEGPKRVDDDTGEWPMRDLWYQLSPGNRRAIMDSARGMIAGQPPRTPSHKDPFPGVAKKVHKTA